MLGALKGRPQTGSELHAKAAVGQYSSHLNRDLFERTGRRGGFAPSL
jgi:hypothetical protein